MSDRLYEILALAEPHSNGAADLWEWAGQEIVRLRLEIEELRGTESPLKPRGLCPDRNEHEAHPYYSDSLGGFWCTADQSQREPGRSERRRA